MVAQVHRSETEEKCSQEFKGKGFIEVRSSTLFLNGARTELLSKFGMLEKA